MNKFHKWLKTWKPIHLCWLFRKLNLPIPSYFIGNPAVELDYMEYATDAAAQAAYVTDATEVVDQQQPDAEEGGGWPLGDYNDKEYRVGQSFQFSVPTWVTAVQIRQDTPVTGSPTGNWTLRIETDDGSGGLGKPSGTLANANASIVVSPPGENTIVKGTFATKFLLDASTKYWLVVQCDNQATNNRWLISANSAGGYANGNFAWCIDGVWTASAGWDLYFKVYSLPFQCYSESTIKTQGSYSLKGIAAITNSLNDTFTRTVSPTIDLSNQTWIQFSVRASRTGSNIKIGIRDSGLTTTEITPNILSADTWQTINWDISGVANADKDAIDRIIVTIVNADA